MTRQPLQNKKITDIFDRLNLAVIRERFDAINARRSQRLLEALSGRHRLFLDVVPLLFHCNHPMLPGFVKRDVPCKIAGYKPDDAALHAAKTIAKSFSYKLELSHPECIYGVFVMGSVGTIAQSDKSDLDFWVCHAPGMCEEDRKLLTRKCDLIRIWAEQQQLETHFFLMDNERFKEGQLSHLDSDSSGSAQRLLLLDEFYRSAIFIAGRRPLWWFISERHEHEYAHYAQRLLHSRFIEARDVLDFGGIANIPEDEFIGAGKWQLYKAIDSPYKSLLKLLLLEVYVHEYPHIRPLSIEFKQAIFDDVTNIDELDSYVIAFRRIEHYLIQQHQIKRLELARRCFYFKVNRSLSCKSSGRRTWQRQLIQKMVTDWGWSQSYCALLDNRRLWKISQVAPERALLVHELMHSYQFLVSFAQRIKSNRIANSHEPTALADKLQSELIVLGRKLQAAFERRPGKIDWVNPNISKSLSEDIIAFSLDEIDSRGPPTWTAHTVNTDAPQRDHSIIRTSNEFVELLLWCYCNGVIVKETYLDFASVALTNQQYKKTKALTSSANSKHTVGNREANRILSIFSAWLPNPRCAAAHQNFAKVAQPERVLLLLNVGASPIQGHAGSIYQKKNPHPAGQEENLVTSVDIITINSWNEVFSRRYDKETALLDALLGYLQLTLPDTHQHPPKLRIDCVSVEYGKNIEQGVQRWLAELSACFYGVNAGHKRYVFQLSKAYHLLQFTGKKPQVRSFAKAAEVISALGDEQKQFSAINMDSHCMRNTVLPLIFSKMRRNIINVFYRRFDIGMELYVADEKGSLTHSIRRGQRVDKPLEPLHRFLRAIINRQARSQPDLLADFGICPIYFHEIHRSDKGQISIKKTPISQNLPQNNMFDVSAVAYTEDGHDVQFDFHCDDQAFSSRSFQDQLFLVVAEFVLSRRRRGENYPIYITDLDLSPATLQITASGVLQVSHFLKIKKLLEDKLNEAIGILLNA